MDFAKRVLFYTIIFLLAFAAHSAGIGAKWIISSLAVVFLLYYGSFFYIHIFTKNMKHVEKFLEKKKDNPYYAIIMASANKDYEKAEEAISRLTPMYNQVKVMTKANICLETNKLREAEEWISHIKSQEHKSYYEALYALIKGDDNVFHQSKKLIKNPVLQACLDAELAFKNGELDEANTAGLKAINASSGIQRWALEKSLAYQNNNPERQSFF